LQSLTINFISHQQNSVRVCYVPTNPPLHLISRHFRPERAWNKFIHVHTM
jgi:hypothetical protein